MSWASVLKVAGCRPSTTNYEARSSVGNGTGFLPRAPYGEGDEIKIEQGD